MTAVQSAQVKMQKKYRRPQLCRLCHYPVVCSGVQILKLDKEALAKWWLLHLDVVFDGEWKKNGWICDFCVSDARYIFLKFEGRGYAKEI
jgi:hypothetical protein